MTITTSPRSLLELSDERDTALQLRLAAYGEGHTLSAQEQWAAGYAAAIGDVKREQHELVRGVQLEAARSAPGGAAIAHTGVGFSFDGKYLVTATAGTGGPADPGQITEWAFSPSLWSEIACASAGHALTSNEWQEYVRPGGPAMPSQLACGS